MLPPRGGAEAAGEGEAEVDGWAWEEVWAGGEVAGGGGGGEAAGAALYDTREAFATPGAAAAGELYDAL